MGSAPFWVLVTATAATVVAVTSPDQKYDDDYPKNVVIIEKIAKAIHNISSLKESLASGFSALHTTIL